MNSEADNQKRNVVVPLNLICDAIDMANDEWRQYLDIEEMEVVSVPEYPFGDDDEDQELADMIEEGWLTRYFALPSRFDIDEYNIMEEFVWSLPEGKVQDTLEGAIRGKGAFRRFKDGVYRFGIEKEWYAFQDAWHRKTAIEWCESHGFGYSGNAVEEETVVKGMQNENIRPGEAQDRETSVKEMQNEKARPSEAQNREPAAKGTKNKNAGPSEVQNRGPAAKGTKNKNAGPSEAQNRETAAKGTKNKSTRPNETQHRNTDQNKTGNRPQKEAAEAAVTETGTEENLAWEEISTEHIVRDEWIDFRRSAYRFPDGSVFEPYYSYSRRDYVVVVASDEEGNYLCVRQFRQGIKEVTTEFPAGGIERTDGREYSAERGQAGAEDSLEAAKRELLEETGYESEQWRHLLTVPSNATIADNYAYIFAAENCRKSGSQKLDETEFLNVRKYTRAQIEEMISQGKFQQAVHIMAWLLAQRK